MKPNPVITKKVSESIADLRSTLIQSTVQLCRLACIKQNEPGEFFLKVPVAIVSSSVEYDKIFTVSSLVDRVYYWYVDNHYYVKYGDDTAGTLAMDSRSLSLDSLVAVYEAVKKTIPKL